MALRSPPPSVRHHGPLITGQRVGLGLFGCGASPTPRPRRSHPHQTDEIVCHPIPQISETSRTHMFRRAGCGCCCFRTRTPGSYPPPASGHRSPLTEHQLVSVALSVQLETPSPAQPSPSRLVASHPRSQRPNLVGADPNSAPLDSTRSGPSQPGLGDNATAAPTCLTLVRRLSLRYYGCCSPPPPPPVQCLPRLALPRLPSPGLAPPSCAPL